jgi:hypothetical protein
LISFINVHLDMNSYTIQKVSLKGIYSANDDCYFGDENVSFMQ